MADEKAGLSTTAKIIGGVVAAGAAIGAAALLGGSNPKPPDVVPEAPKHEAGSLCEPGLVFCPSTSACAPKEACE